MYSTQCYNIVSDNELGLQVAGFYRRIPCKSIELNHTSYARHVRSLVSTTQEGR